MVVGIVLVNVLFSRRYKNLPPGPWGLPILGHMHMLGPYPHRDLAKLAETHGPLMTLRFGQQLTVVASNAAAAKEILNTQDLNFSNRMPISFGELVLPNGHFRPPALCFSLWKYCAVDQSRLLSVYLYIRNNSF